MDAALLEVVLGTVRTAIEYDVELPDDIAVNVCVTLCDTSAANALAEYARGNGASEYGLMFIKGLPGAPENPILWEYMEAHGHSGVGFTPADGDPDLSADAHEFCARTLFLFFKNIPHVAPHLWAKAKELSDACELGQMVEVDEGKLH